MYEKERMLSFFLLFISHTTTNTHIFIREKAEKGGMVKSYYVIVSVVVTLLLLVILTQETHVACAYDIDEADYDKMKNISLLLIRDIRRYVDEGKSDVEILDRLKADYKEMLSGAIRYAKLLFLGFMDYIKFNLNRMYTEFTVSQVHFIAKDVYYTLINMASDNDVIYDKLIGILEYVYR